MGELPDWIPELIKPILEALDQHPRTSGPRREVMDRLKADSRMGVVYDEFLRRNRQTGGFYHPCRGLSEASSAEEAQSAAIRDLLQLVISAAGDRITVSKIEEIEEAAKLRWANAPIVIDRNGRILAGHARYKAAEYLGMTNAQQAPIGNHIVRDNDDLADRALRS